MTTNLRLVSLCAAFFCCTPLLAAGFARTTGIPLDSDYLIFVVDTSGSMRRFEWDRVQQQIAETLEAYPQVNGIQVLNDEGNHLFMSSMGEWVADTPQSRREILEALADWNAFSNSSPRRGILQAIDSYADPEKRIALHVFSDDLSSGAASIAALVREIDAANAAGDGRWQMRIHAVGFPIYYDQTGAMGTASDYAALMNAVSQRNGGSFVGLPSRQSPNEPSAERTLFLLDASAGMAGEKWRRAVRAVDELIALLPAGSVYRLVVFNDRADDPASGAGGDWHDAGDASARADLIGALASMTPAGAMSLVAGIGAAERLEPRADNVFLLAGGTPTEGSAIGAQALLERALGEPGRGVPINVVLFDADPESGSASSYWQLALATGGSLLAPAEDWP